MVKVEYPMKPGLQITDYYKSKFEDWWCNLKDSYTWRYSSRERRLFWWWSNRCNNRLNRWRFSRQILHWSWRRFKLHFFQYTQLYYSQECAPSVRIIVCERIKLPGALGTETIGSPAGALPPAESACGGATTLGTGAGRDGWEALGGGALLGLWDSGGLIGTWPNPFEASGNGDGGDDNGGNKSNPVANNSTYHEAKSNISFCNQSQFDIFERLRQQLGFWLKFLYINNKKKKRYFTKL